MRLKNAKTIITHLLLFYVIYLNITVTNEVARMPFVENKDFAMFCGNNFEVVAILNVTRGRFCDFVHNIVASIGQPKYFTYAKSTV